MAFTDYLRLQSAKGKNISPQEWDSDTKISVMAIALKEFEKSRPISIQRAELLQQEKFITERAKRDPEIRLLQLNANAAHIKSDAEYEKSQQISSSLLTREKM